MLVCPDCQFENPNTNKFCQKCGTSLTHKPCQECGTQVPINAETCHNCGAFTGAVWRAIICKESNSLVPPTASPEAPLEASASIASEGTQIEGSQTNEPVAEDRELSQLEMPPDEIPVPSAASNLPSMGVGAAEEASSQTPTPPPTEESSDEDVTQPLIAEVWSTVSEGVSEGYKGEMLSPSSPAIYLDPQNRYRLLEPLNIEKTCVTGEAIYGASVRVLDCQPFQKSPLETLMEQQPSISQRVEQPGSKDEMNHPSTLYSDSWNILGIPAIAQPYLSLQNAYYPTLPQVHDAWEREGEAVVLLEDRSGWQILSELWDSEQLSSLQILYWLDEMAKLWEALEPWHCRQSLLEISNLRVDEDQSLGLVRLYPEAKEQILTLQDLGHMWQTLFEQSQRTQFMALSSVFRQMCTQEIETIAELRSHLSEIAREQPVPVTAVSPSPDSALEEAAAINVSLETEDTEGEGAVTPPFPVYDPGISNEGDVPTVILPMQLMSLDDAGCTDIGRLREHNEDYFGIQTEVKKQENPTGRTLQACGLYILCDGMGGHAGGEVASAMAVDTIKRYFRDKCHDQLPTEDSIREAVRLANQAVYDVNQQNARSGSARMGTTLVMMIIHNTTAAIAHVGDSRLYRLTRKRGLEQLTIDHEVGQREINRGVEPQIAYTRPDAYQLTQAVGPRSEQFINPDVQFLEINEDTLFLLCSDGLSDNDLVEAHWQTHLAPLLSSRANLDQGIVQLIELANEHNGHDNITALLIRVKVRPNFEQQQPL